MKSSLIILLFIASASTVTQKGGLNICRWHVTDKIEADDYQLIKKAKLYYSLSNDKDNLYVDFKFEDQGVQNGIQYDGLTIWINMDGKAVRKMGVRYPMGSLNVKNPSYPVNTIELIGFTSEQERHFSADNQDNFRGSVNNNENGILYYKLIIPLGKIPVRNAKEGNGAMPFSLGIEYGTTSDLYWINQVKLATSK
jgi:hypothetical protein